MLFAAPIVCVGFVIDPCFVIKNVYFQSSRCRRESWLLCFVCVLVAVWLYMSVFCVSFSCYRGFVCGLYCGISGHTCLFLESSVIYCLNRNRVRHKLTDMTKHLYFFCCSEVKKGACLITSQIKQILSVKRLFIFKIL